MRDPVRALVEHCAMRNGLMCADYYQKVYPRAFKKGIELARKCEGLRHIIAISSPGEAELIRMPVFVLRLSLYLYHD